MKPGPNPAFLSWYIKKEKENIEKTTKKRRQAFIKKLERNPSKITKSILDNLHNDALKAQKELRRAILIIYTSEFAQSITDELRKHFLKKVA